MTTLKDFAQTYESKKTKNVTDLPSIDISEPIERRNGKDAEGKPFDYLVLVRDGDDYRVPFSAVEQIQTLLENMPNLTTVKVTKKGEGMNTKYSVIPITDSMQKA